MTIAADTRLGRYEIRSQIGAGGMGEVYLAEDTTLRRLVAIKLLPEEFTSDRERLHRFEREAFAASSLNHPNILTIHEIGKENGHHFIATEFIDGESLRQHQKDNRLELHEVLEIGVQGASALVAAHAARIVHRDIKPENIMVRKDGIVKVLDFGLAKLAEQEQKPALDTEAPTKALHHTAPGVVMGTASYMSPEQARGKEVDERTDVWSLGVVLYEMIAGRLPFEGETTTDVLGLILHKEPPPLTHLGTHIPAELDRIVTKALKKDKEERYQVVKDLGLDLKSLKQRLEFEAERDRTETPGRSSQARGAATTSEGGAGTAGTSKIAARPTGQAAAGGDLHTTSSAEYIVTEIKRHKRGAGLVLAALVVAIAGLAYFYFVQSTEASINSVAIMPFVNVSQDPNTEYLSDGISESLINSMSQLSQLKVIARSSTFRYKGKEIEPEEVAKTLGVGAIVTGRVAQRGDELQVSVELMNAQDKTQMWGEQYNRRAADLQAVQAEIARTISEKLRLRLTGAQEQQITKQATQNPEAYQLYLTGLFYFRKGNIENIKKALDYYTQAVALDPKFALAYASMAVSYSNLTTSGANPAEMLAKGRAAAQKALELDDSLAEAHAALAVIKRDEWDWSGAENEFKRAIELNPNLAAAHGNYALYLSIMGRAAEALAEIKRAQELDPLRIAIKSGEASILYYARRYDEAIQVFQNVIKMQPDYANAHIYLGFAYAAKGQYAEAIAAYQKDISISGETPSTLCFLGYAYGMSGKRDEALAILNKLRTTKEHVSPVELATLYVGLGDKEAALESLERAYQAHHPQMQYLKVQPHHDVLRTDPRFQDLVRRVGLP
ncbi:MAG: protein kinase, partial [Acidobacteriota bacterium]|nr:protein kinase [Acidobacteriota bacterium]